VRVVLHAQAGYDEPASYRSISLIAQATSGEACHGYVGICTSLQFFNDCGLRLVDTVSRNLEPAAGSDTEQLQTTRFQVR
jgi:hypothetical protein